VVDGTGHPLASDHLLLFLARDLLARRPGATVVADVKCSRLLFEGVEHAGGHAVMAPSGYVLIRQAMQRSGALLAGELSGHIFFADDVFTADWDGTDDALYAAVRVLKALAGDPAALLNFRASLPPTFATPEFRLACADPQGVVRALADRSPGARLHPAMGLRQSTADGWWLARASGAEAKISCRCESGTAEGLERLKTALFARLQACGVVLEV
jgi:phosphomannomutase